MYRLPARIAQARIAPAAGVTPLDVTTEAMTFQQACTITPGLAPPEGFLLQAQLFLELADPMRIWVGVPSSIDASGRRILVDHSVTPVALGAMPDPWKAGYLWFDAPAETLNLNTGTAASPIATPVGGAGYIASLVGTGALLATISSLAARVAALEASP